MTLHELVQAFYGYMRTHNAVGTVAYYRRHIDRFLAHVGDVAIAELRKHHLLTWATTWHAMQAVQRLFTWGHVDAELIERNPFKGIKRPRLGGRRRVLSRRDSLRMLRGADRRFRPYLIALCQSIARPQEMKQVTWEDIRWEGEHAGMIDALQHGQAFFELCEYKSRQQRTDPTAPRVILINARFARLLVRIARQRTTLSGRIFLNQFDQPLTTNAIRLRIRRLCKRIGLNADARGEPVVAYTFRHTAATDATAKGIHDRILAEIMGHTSTRTTARYQHPSRQHLRDALGRLDKPR